MKFSRNMATICLIAVLLSGGCKGKEDKEIWHELKDQPAGPLAITPNTFVNISKEQKPAVVNINTSKIIKGHPDVPMDPFSGKDFHGGRRRENPFEDFFEEFFGRIPRREFKQKSLGTGFIINKSGYILTNAHVVEEVDEINVTLSDEKEYPAKVVGADKKIDVALLKIESSNDLPVVNLGDSDKIEVGEWVIAIGNPFGLEHTVTSGIISAKGRVLGAGPYDDYLQTDASINPGNSGGPLFNLRGEVVGINTAIVSEGQGIGFAIPINLVKDILRDLEEKGEVTRGWLGLVIQKITPGLAKSFNLKESKGALVAEVIPGSPAEKAGIKQGDIVVKFNDLEIDNYSDLSRLAAKTPPDTKVTLEVIREGKTNILTAAIGTYPKDEKLAYMTQKVSSKLGMTVENITRELRDYFGLRESKGVVVTNVEENSLAEDAKITPGTVIVEVNRKIIGNIEDYQAVIEMANSGDSLLLLVKKGDHSQYLTINIP